MLGHEARAVLGMDVPVIGNEHVAEHNALSDEEGAILPVESVGAGEIDELGCDMIARSQRRHGLIDAIEAADDLAAVSADLAQDYRCAESCLSDGASGNGRFVSIEAYRLGHGQPGDAA